MQSMSARDAKNSFGKLIDMARAEPVTIEKHGRTVVVVLSIESYELMLSSNVTFVPLESAHAKAAARPKHGTAATRRTRSPSERK